MGEAKLSEMTGISKIRVAVIGDVGVDYAFISQEPPKGRSVPKQPWTYNPGTHLFAIPGGAWFTGHMVQAALEGPRFSRMYEARVRDGIDIRLEGRYEIDAKDEQDLLFSIQPLPETKLIVYVNEERCEYSGIKITLNSPAIKRHAGLKRSSHTIDVKLGVHNCDLEFNTEDDDKPGRIEVSQTKRCFEACRFRVRDAEKRAAFYAIELYVTGQSITSIRLESETGELCSIQPAPGSGIRIVSDDPGRGFNILAHDAKSQNNKTCFEFDTGKVEVLSGRFDVHARMVDFGKLNHGWKNASDRQIEIMRAKIPQEPRPHEFELANTNVEDFIWFYAHPGKSIRMADSEYVVRTLSELRLFSAHVPHSEGGGRVYRRAIAHGVEGPQASAPTILNESWANIPNSPLAQEFESASATESCPTIVVVDDEGLGYSEDARFWVPFLIPADCVENVRGFADGSEKEVLQLAEWHNRVEHYLEHVWLVIKASHWIKVRDSLLLKFVQKTSLKDRCILVVSGETLRNGFIGPQGTPGIKLAKKVSWERTIEDFHRAVGEGALGALCECRHIIVRLGLDGALHWSRDSNEDDVDEARQDVQETKNFGSLSLFFDRERIEGEYSDAVQCGDLAGLTTVFVAGLIRKLYRSWRNERREKGEISPISPIPIEDGIKFALQSCRRYYDLGYGPEPRTVKLFEDLRLPIVQLFGDAPLDGCVNRGAHRFGVFKAHKLSDNSFSGYRSILGEHLRHVRPHHFSSQSLPEDRRAQIARNALDLGRKIVLLGPQRAFHEAKPNFPSALFGKLLVVERREIEGLRSIKNLFAEYLSRMDRRTPISVAVFGPPGSGKSFGVKQLAQEVAGRRSRLEEFTFNLAQFSSFNQLTELLLQVRDAGLDDRLPLVFFDEFDCEFEGKPLGWLKYFLAPMQDGRFQHHDNMLGIGKAILVFAGGIAPAHSAFRSANFWADRYGKHAEKDWYASAKGPDFHSRLRGFLDIVGVNPEVVERTHPSSYELEESGSKRTEDFGDDENFSFVVRRAVIIRQIIERIADTEKAILDVNRRAYFDEDVLNAMLLSFRYFHGVRSIESIVDMSTLHEQREFSKTCLPSAGQFQMHVDGSFRSILLREYNGLNKVLKELFTKGFTAIIDERS